MKKVSKVWIGAGALLVVAVAIWLFSGSEKREEIAFETAKMAPANIQNSITATG